MWGALRNNKMNDCIHEYLNKWDGIYVCMDCSYKLNSVNDSDRIKYEEEEELKILPDVVPPNMTIGKMSQQRGVSIRTDCCLCNIL